jgi:hypothetical protein
LLAASTLPVEETVAPVTEPVVFIFAPETSPTATTLPVEETVAPVTEPVVMIAPDADRLVIPLMLLPSDSTVIWLIGPPIRTVPLRPPTPVEKI